MNFTPGKYHSLSNENYHMAPGLSCSSLKVFEQSKAHYELMIEKRRDEEGQENINFTEDHFIIGSATHLAILEPERFKQMVVRGPKTRRGNAWNDIIEDNPSKYVLTEKDYCSVVEMQVAVLSPEWHNDSTASKILSSGESEVSYFWEDNDTGLLCRCRPDFLPDNQFSDCIIDLKTTAEGMASPAVFPKRIYNFGYDMQAAFYLDGVNNIENGKYKRFIFIVVEIKPPYLTAVYELDRLSIDVGRQKYRELLNKFYDYTQEENPCMTYFSGIQEISLPDWAIKRSQLDGE